MSKLYDTFSISNKIGRLDLFLTITCSSKWLEIERALLPGQVPQGRQNIAVQVLFMTLGVKIH